MKKTPYLLKVVFLLPLCLGIAGCASIPKGFLKPSETSLENRQLQMRQYDTTDEVKIITSVAGVLQDLGFTLDESETKLGLVVASKAADAKSAGQIAVAFALDVLFGTNSTKECDRSQVLKAAVVTRLSLDGKKTVVRVTFQRVIYDMEGHANRAETVSEPEIYQKFYTNLSQSIFLEEQKI
jgi:hypothetical protein